MHELREMLPPDWACGSFSWLMSDVEDSAHVAAPAPRDDAPGAIYQEAMNQQWELA